MRCSRPVNPIGARSGAYAPQSSIFATILDQPPFSDSMISEASARLKSQHPPLIGLITSGAVLAHGSGIEIASVLAVSAGSGGP